MSITFEKSGLIKTVEWDIEKTEFFKYCMYFDAVGVDFSLLICYCFLYNNITQEMYVCNVISGIQLSYFSIKAVLDWFSGLRTRFN